MRKASGSGRLALVLVPTVVISLASVGPALALGRAQREAPGHGPALERGVTHTAKPGRQEPSPGAPQRLPGRTDPSVTALAAPGPSPEALLDGALARVGDRVAVAPTGVPAIVLVYASWSAPSLLERELLTEVASRSLPAARLVLLDADDPAAARPLAAIGGASVVPFALLVDSRGIVRQRYLGWPAQSPSAIRRTLELALASLR